jgi:hypothetical protein
MLVRARAIADLSGPRDITATGGELLQTERRIQGQENGRKSGSTWRPIAVAGRDSHLQVLRNGDHGLDRHESLRLARDKAHGLARARLVAVTTGARQGIQAGTAAVIGRSGVMTGVRRWR